MKDDSAVNSEVFANLNTQQLEAVKHFTGPILLLAGAGSGKTRVLTRRVANLVLNHRINPRRILAVTFTNKATDEMRARLRSLLKQDADSLWVSTFHAAGARILRQHAHHLGYSNSFAIYDDQDTKGVLKAIIKQLGLDEKKFPPGLFAKIIDDAKNSLIFPEEYEKNAGKDLGPGAQVYTLYQQALKRANAMDFGDLLSNTILLFRKHPEVLKTYQEGLQFVLVDEFQDTNLAQYQFSKLLVAKHNNIFVVGDDDQSIYSFRGASIGHILNFESDFAGTKVVKLEQNYRSTANILSVSHAVIEKNRGRKEKKLWTEAQAGSAIVTFLADDELDEAEFIAREIEELLRSGLTLEQIAIFYRTNAQSRAIEEALMNHFIPYRIFGGLKFYERKEIKDILAYLRLIANPRDDQAFLRCINTPPRGIGPQSVRTISENASKQGLSLFEAAQTQSKRSAALETFLALINSLQIIAHNSSLAELVKQTIELSDYAQTLKAAKDAQSLSRLENLNELEAIARTQDDLSDQHMQNLQKFLERAALASGADLPQEHQSSQGGAQKVPMLTLMTLHLAKGLEYPVAFLTGMEEGLLPHYRSLNDPTAIEEERRLCYVGITRAMQKLYLTRAFSRGMFTGGDMFGSFRNVSRFALDIPAEYLDQQGRDFCSDGFGISIKEALEENPDGDLLEQQRPAEEAPKPASRKKARSGWSLLSADDLEF